MSRYDCILDSIIKSADILGADYRLMMIERLGLSYDVKSKGESIGEKILLPWDDKESDRIRRLEHHGLTYRIIEGSPQLNFQFKEPMESPITIIVDSYDCWWIPFFHAQHLPHAITIINKGNESTYVDNYLGVQIEDSKVIEFILHNYMYCYVFSICSQKSVNLYNELMQFMSKSRNQNIIEKLFYDLSRNMELKKEIPNDIEESQLIRKLKDLSDSRVNAIEFVEYLEETRVDIELSEVRSLLFTLSNYYGSLRSYLIKCYLKHKDQSPEIIDNIVDLILRNEIRLNTELLYIRDIFNDKQ